MQSMPALASANVEPKTRESILFVNNFETNFPNINEIIDAKIIEISVFANEKLASLRFFSIAKFSKLWVVLINAYPTTNENVPMCFGKNKIEKISKDAERA